MRVFRRGCLFRFAYLGFSIFFKFFALEAVLFQSSGDAWTHMSFVARYRWTCQHDIFVRFLLRLILLEVDPYNRKQTDAGVSGVRLGKAGKPFSISLIRKL